MRIRVFYCLWKRCVIRAQCFLQWGCCVFKVTCDVAGVFAKQIRLGWAQEYEGFRGLRF